MWSWVWLVWWPGMGGQTVAVLLSIHKNFPAFNDKNLLSITTHHTRKRRRRQELPCTGPKGGYYIWGVQSTGLVGSGGWGGRFIGRKPQSVTAAPPYNPPDAQAKPFSAKLSSSFDTSILLLWNRPLHVNITTVWLFLCERLRNCKISKTKMPYSSWSQGSFWIHCQFWCSQFDFPI